MRVEPEVYAGLDLRAPDLLAGAPLHDAWAVDLPGGVDRSIADIRTIVSFENLAQINAVVRRLFSLRGWLGRVFGWDGERPIPAGSSFLSRLSEEDRRASLVEPGTPEGPFRVLYVSQREAISEIQNSTVHAFSVFALFEQPGGAPFLLGHPRAARRPHHVVVHAADRPLPSLPHLPGRAPTHQDRVAAERGRYPEDPVIQSTFGLTVMAMIWATLLGAGLAVHGCRCVRRADCCSPSLSGGAP